VIEDRSDSEAGFIRGDAADRDHGCATQHGEPHVVDHLTGVLLEHGDGVCALGGARDGLGRERPQRDGSQVANARAFGAGPITRRQAPCYSPSRALSCCIERFGM